MRQKFLTTPGIGNMVISLQGGAFDLQTGLEVLQDPEDLYEIDQHYLEEMEEKRQLLRTRGAEVFSSTPEVRSWLYDWIFGWRILSSGGMVV